VIRRVATLAVAALVVTLAGVTGLAGSAPAATPKRQFPPTSFEAFSKIFDPALARLGLRVMRVHLEQPPRYTVSPHGQRLAVYVEPTGGYTAANYLENLGPVAAIFLPTIFDRWPGVRSFDVCQEPLPSVGESPEPTPVTEIVASRRGAARISWHDVTLADLVALQQRGHALSRLKATDFGLYLDPALRADPAYQQALAARA